MVAIGDDEGERRAQRAAMAKAGQDFDPVLLDALPGAAAVALLAAAEIGVDPVPVEDETRREPLRMATNAGPWDSPAVASRASRGQA